MVTVFSREKTKFLGCLLSLWFLAILFRLPLLINLDTINADYAIVGLQAMEILRGAEWDWFLWGVGYQASLEPVLVAIGFYLLGKHTLVLTAVPLIGYFVLLFFAFSIIQKRVGLAWAFFLMLFMVLTPLAFSSVTIFPPRQWSFTSIFAGIYLADGVSQSRHPRFRLAAGVFLAFFALYIDFFSIQFFLPALGFVFASCWDGGAGPDVVKTRQKAFFWGVGVGSAFLILTRFLDPKGGAPLAYNFNVIFRNIGMFFRDCLPSVMGYSDSFFLGEVAGKLLFGLAGLGLLFLLGLAGWWFFKNRKMDWAVRKLGMFGAFVALMSVMGFIGSPRVMDIYASRYLAPILWAAPFGLAPLVFHFSRKKVLSMLIPILVVMAVGSWVGYDPAVKNFVPVRFAEGQGLDAIELGDRLREKGVQHALAPYWVSYRLSYLLDMNPLVVPNDAGADRYPPHAKQVREAPVVAEIFHKDWEHIYSSEAKEKILSQSNLPYEKFTLGDYTVLIIRR